MNRRSFFMRCAGPIGPGADFLTEMVERIRGGSARAPEPDDVGMVVAAAAAVGVSEFDFFCAAWRQWHGVAFDRARMEQIFAGYLHEQRVPGWARHFARHVVAAAGDGTLDRGKLGLQDYARWEPLPDLSCRLTTEVLGCVLLGLIVVVI